MALSDLGCANFVYSIGSVVRYRDMDDWRESEIIGVYQGEDRVLRLALADGRTLPVPTPRDHPGVTAATAPWRATHRHHKGGFYRVTGLARHTETNEALVVYDNAQGATFARPWAMFHGFVDAGSVKRFAELSDADYPGRDGKLPPETRPEDVAPAAMTPGDGRPETLSALVRHAVAAFEAMAPEDKARHREAQRRSWVRGEMNLIDRSAVTPPDSAEVVTLSLDSRIAGVEDARLIVRRTPAAYVMARLDERAAELRELRDSNRGRSSPETDEELRARVLAAHDAWPTAWLNTRLPPFARGTIDVVGGASLDGVAMCYGLTRLRP